MILSFFRKTTELSYPLSPLDASTGESLKEYVPPERLYTIGPFYCDLSPHSHKGIFRHAIDFIVRDGSLVYAVRSGKVIDLVESNDKFGAESEYADQLNYVTINHGGYLSQYAHLKKGSASAYGIHVGKQVMRGQVIGVVGKTGWVDFGENGDHLHFMVFREGRDGPESIPVVFR